MESIITVKGLKKYFKDVKAVDDISFSVEKGELLGFLGVNGAGKSTTINMLCTLFSPTQGDITICGCRLGKEDEKIRHHIGVVWQGNCLDEKLTVKENLFVRGSLYGFNTAALKRQVASVCEKLQLDDIYDRRYANLSGGQKRRCEIAAALIHSPEVLFLDEPTTGLDPATRRLVWESMDRLQKEEGTTIFLTTHYMEEAACARHIAIMDSGKLKEFGTPFSLKERYAKDKLHLIPQPDKMTSLRQLLSGMQIQASDVTVGSDRLIVSLPDSMAGLPLIREAEPYLSGFSLVQGSMDDVFLNVTGKNLQQEEL